MNTTLANGVPDSRVASHSANLDLLRSVAVCAVVITHLSDIDSQNANNLTYVGVAGVLLFFVHTANVLLQSLERLHGDGLGRVTLRFFTQRIFRIYPLYLAAIAVAIATRVPWVWWSPNPSAPWLGWRWLTDNLLLIQNFATYPTISAPMWSLPYEMQMYLALPVIYFLTKRKEPIVRLALVSLFAVFAASFTTGFIHSAWVQPTFYVPCFMGGAYAFALSRQRRVAPWYTLPILLVSCIALFSWLRHPSLQWLICTVIGFSLPKIREVRVPVICNTCQVVAKYSYGIYLWHFPLLWFWFRKVEVTETVRFVAFFVSLALVCTASYHLLESPMTQVGRGIAKRSVASVPVGVPANLICNS